MNEQHNLSERKALESLVCAILHQFDITEAVSDKDIDEFLESGYLLDDEQRKALARLSSDPVLGITTDGGDLIVTDIVHEAVELAGMYRHSSDDALDDKTRELIIQKRQQIIERLRRKGKDGDGHRD